MKKIRFLFTILVCIAISTSAAYAQNDKFSKSRSGSFSSSSSNKSSTSKTSSSSSRSKSSSSNKSSKSSSSKSSSFSSSRNSSPRSSSSYSSSRNNSSAPKTSRNNSFSTSRSTATSPKQRNTDTGYNSSRSSQKTSSSTFSSKQKSQTASSPSQARTRTATANINHSRERLKQRTRNYTASAKVSTSGTTVNSGSAAAALSQPRSSNFVYSPLKNSVMKMLPTKSSAKSSPRQMTHSGLWSQCANNWAGNQSTNKSLVQSYAKQNLNMELIDYGFSGGVLYVIANDSKGTFLQACNQDGTVLDEQEVLPGYCTIFTSEENSGCWIMKRNDADPLYYCFDGTHLTKYTPDEGKDIIDFDFCEMVTYTITRENQHTYFQIYNDTDQQPLASTEINGDYNTIDVEASECRCYIKDPENNQAAEMIWLGDEIMIMEEE